MKEKYKSIEELKDRAILFEKDLPPFGYGLLLIVSVLLLGIGVWSAYAKKPSMIVAQGMVTNRDSSYVMSLYTGVIEECYMEEGMLVQEGDVLFTLETTEYNLQEEQLMANKAYYEKLVRQADKLVQSVKDDKNYFDAADSEDELYYSMFENYKAQIEQNKFDPGPYLSYGYSETQILAEMEKNQAQVAAIYYQTVQTAENMKMEAQTQIENIDAQIMAVSEGKKDLVINAPSTGILHMISDYQKGMVVQTGSTIATITPENHEIVVEGYVTTADRARMAENDQVQMVVDGLSQNLYGTIQGTVDQMDSNITMVEGENGVSNAMFKVKILPETNYVISPEGNKVNLTNGMTVEARITYDEETYLLYLLDSLGLHIKK